MRLLAPLVAAIARRPVAAPPTPDPTADPFARLVVFGAWVAMTAWLFTFVAANAPPLPVFDEYYNLEILARPTSELPRRLFQQHNEHRIPVPRAVYFAVLTATNYDFKAMCFVDAGLLAVACLAVMRAIARARGRVAYTDVFVPLVVLNIGQWENLLWGFQIQFIASTAMALGVIALVLDPRFGRCPWRVGGVGLATILLPGCGANGVGVAAPLVVFLTFVGVRAWRIGDTRVSLVALASAAVAGLSIPLYFAGLEPCDHHPHATSPTAIGQAFVQVLTLTLGTAGAAAHGPGGGWPAVGLGVVAAVAATGVLAVARLADAEKRTTALGLAAVAVGVLAVAGGVGIARSGLDNEILAVNRYTTLMVPLAVGVYAAWAVLGPPAVGRLAQGALLLAAAVSLWPNAAEAKTRGTTYAAVLQRAKYEMRAGMPLSFVVDRYPHLFPTSRDGRAKHFAALRDKSVRPFAQAGADPDFVQTELTVRVEVADGLVRDGDGWRTVAAQARLTLAFPEARNVYGLLLEYELTPAAGQTQVGNVLTPGLGVTFPNLPGRESAHQLRPTPTGSVETRLFVDGACDRVRLDLYGPGATVRVRRVVALTGP